MSLASSQGVGALMPHLTCVRAHLLDAERCATHSEKLVFPCYLKLVRRSCPTWSDASLLPLPPRMAHLAPSLSCLTDLRMFDLGGQHSGCGCHRRAGPCPQDPHPRHRAGLCTQHHWIKRDVALV